MPSSKTVKLPTSLCVVLSLVGPALLILFAVAVVAFDKRVPWYFFGGGVFVTVFMPSMLLNRTSWAGAVAAWATHRPTPPGR